MVEHFIVAIDSAQIDEFSKRGNLGIKLLIMSLKLKSCSTFVNCDSFTGPKFDVQEHLLLTTIGGHKWHF
jgi:hypothetical protein